MIDLRDLWEGFADTQCRGYSPIYDRVSRAVATDGDLLALVREAPPVAHHPIMLLAAVHYLLLAGLRHPLADVYAGATQADPAPLFRDVCLSHRAELLEIMASRRIQTNEVGRSAVIGPALTWVADRFDQPLHLVDVGASAGLNLLCDAYLLDYGDRGTTGPAEASVRIACRVVSGTPPIGSRLPAIEQRIGIDRDPPDLGDPDDARWQLACVWPDTNRLPRTALAIELAQRDLPPVVKGDALTVLPEVIDGLAPGGLACVLTTWVLAYFRRDERARFAQILTDAGKKRPLVWIAAEGPHIVDLMDPGELPDHGAEPSVLTAVSFDANGAHPTLLGFVHAHGLWLDWRA